MRMYFGTVESCDGNILTAPDLLSSHEYLVLLSTGVFFRVPASLRFPLVQLTQTKRTKYALHARGDIACNELPGHGGV